VTNRFFEAGETATVDVRSVPPTSTRKRLLRSTINNRNPRRARHLSSLQLPLHVPNNRRWRPLNRAFPECRREPDRFPRTFAPFRPARFPDNPGKGRSLLWESPPRAI